LTEEALQANASQLRQNQWRLQKSFDVDYIPSNDFSFYDTMLNTSVMFNTMELYFIIFEHSCPV